MILNIPLNIDDAALEGKLAQEYEAKVLMSVNSRIDEVLREHGNSYYYRDRTPREGLDCMIHSIIDDRVRGFMEENREAIIEKTAENLGNRLARSKKGKAILDELEEK